MKQSIEQALMHAAAFLKTQQQPDGSFLSYSSRRQNPFQAEYTYCTIFAPALILNAITHIEISEAKDVSSRIARFLLQQKSKKWSFNYWARESVEAATMPYPDDLDDTFCALSALWQYDARLIDAQALAHIVKLLLAAEETVGGPYRTWLVAEDASKRWRDIDVAVNANIAYFLMNVSRPLPNLTAMLGNAMRHQSFHSPYYPGEYPLYYYVARAYRGTSSQRLTKYIKEKRQNGWWETPLQTALAVNALAQSGENDVADAIRRLLDAQQSDGSWKAESFCLDPMRNGVTYYGGSAALTTAFVMEALYGYAKFDKKKIVTRKTSDLSFSPPVKAVAKALKKDSPELQKESRILLRTIIKSRNGNEVALLPRAFYKGLRDPVQLPDQLFTELGKANIYGWMAYTIYDDFLDSEGDSPKRLSIANVALRRSLDAFNQALPKHQEFKLIVRKAFDSIDAANAWEIEHCRFPVKDGRIVVGNIPEYKTRRRLAERSLGHTLTPLGVLCAMGLSPQDSVFTSIQKALRHYLIAKQLSDDIHDWKDDLVNGRISYVVAVLLADAKVLPGEYDISMLLPQLERCFWHFTLRRICQNMRYHVRQGHAAVRESTILQRGNIIEMLLEEINRTVEVTQAKLDQAEDFLRAFQK